MVEVTRCRPRSRRATCPAGLHTHWTSGCRNSAELWRRLKSEGFFGSLRVVGEWATRRRRGEKASDQQLQKVPSARTIARLMTTARDHMSKADSITIAAIEAGVPTLVDARTRHACSALPADARINDAKRASFEQTLRQVLGGKVA